MTAGIPEAAGPPCDFTPEYAAIMSIMNLADYSQVKVCAQCAPEYLLAIVQAITGAAPDGEMPAGIAADGDQDQGAPEPETDECPLCGQMIELDQIPAHVDMHAAEGDGSGGSMLVPGPARPDPLTAHTIKSTHGHRRPKGAAAAADPGTDAQ